MVSYVRSAAALMVAALALPACSKTATAPGPSPQSVSAVARFYNGATPAAGGAAQSRARLSAPSALTAHVPPPAGQATQSQGNCTSRCWFLSPDKITMTLTGIQPNYGAGTAGPLITVDCPVTYDKTKPGMTQLVDCPFTAPVGTYTGLTLFVSSTMQVLINDAVGGFYSTSTGIVTSPPAGGAQPFTVTIGGTIATELQEPNVLQAPLVVSANTPVTFSVVVNGLQSFKVAVSGGAVTLGWPGTAYTDPGRPDWAVSVGSLASVAFYSNQSIGTTGSFCAGGCVSPIGIQSVNVYYATPTTPEMVAIPVNGLPPGCGPFGLSWVVNSKSYLGLDGGGNLGWAIPTDQTYSAYAVEMRMAQVSTIGASTTLYCKNIATDPAPQGGSFASGAPGIVSPSNVVGTYILLAH
jgi:hypothetical protein